ncbi:MAG TPA: hypothetical protein VFU29_11505, partial [Chitinophagaceae bacterium]|nr:hypothetical protein [Chitinophagaceae bacterium]
MKRTIKILLFILYPLLVKAQSDPPEAFIEKYNAANTNGEKGKCIIDFIQDDTSFSGPSESLLAYFIKQNDEVGIDYMKMLINKSQSVTLEYTGGLKELFEILSRFRKRKDKYGEMWTFSGIATTFAAAKNYDTAIVYSKKALSAAVVLGDTNRIYNSLNDIAYTYYDAHKPDSGIVYAKQAVNMCYQFKITFFLAYALSTLGELYMEKGQYDTALPMIRESTRYIRYDSFALVSAYNDYVECFTAIGRNDSVLYYSQQVRAIADRNGLISSLLRCYEYLYKFFDKLNMPDSSNKYFRLATVIKDSLYDVEKLRLVQNISFNELQKSQEEIQKQRAQQNRIKFYSLLFVLLLFLIIAIVLYRNNRQKKKANKILQQQKQEIEYQRDKTNEALSELKSAQSQLIQSEKMASLGELTAGIAHEIQNPLNFVNNFSDVNTELVDEAEQEMNKGNISEAKIILNDIKENEQKINHHGKRADAIVKGMLQHSRTSSGQKEPTDINALCDEYLRLAYHGLRAKDKSFNAITKTEFDDNIGKIKVNAQEIGRVILNLINNAFYAVNEKAKQNISGYEPIVRVSSEKVNGKVEIRVKDNGNGIPQ